MKKINRNILSDSYLMSLAIKEDLKLKSSSLQGKTSKSSLGFRLSCVFKIRESFFKEGLVLVHSKNNIYEVYRYNNGYYEKLYDIFIVCNKYEVGVSTSSPKVTYYSNVKYTFFCNRIINSSSPDLDTLIYRIENANYDKAICNVKGDKLYININKLYSIKKM